MKNIILILLSVLVFASCEKVETTPSSTKDSTSTVDSNVKLYTVYEVSNPHTRSFNFKIYGNKAAFIKDSDVLYEGKINAGGTLYLTMKDFSKTDDDGRFYIDFYSDDLMYSIDFDNVGEVMLGTYEVYKSSEVGMQTADTSTLNIGTDKQSYKRKILFGSLPAPLWYDISSPNNKTYAFNRGSRSDYNVVFKMNGKEYKGYYSYEETTRNSQPMIKVTIDISKTLAQEQIKDMYIVIVNGGGTSTPFGSATLEEFINGFGGNMGRKYAKK